MHGRDRRRFRLAAGRPPLRLHFLALSRCGDLGRPVKTTIGAMSGVVITCRKCKTDYRVFTLTNFWCRRPCPTCAVTTWVWHTGTDVRTQITEPKRKTHYR